MAKKEAKAKFICQCAENYEGEFCQTEIPPPVVEEEEEKEEEEEEKEKEAEEEEEKEEEEKEGEPTFIASVLEEGTSESK